MDMSITGGKAILKNAAFGSAVGKNEIDGHIGIDYILQSTNRRYS